MKGVNILDLEEFLIEAKNHNTDLTNKIYYVCNFSPNKNNLLKKITSNLKPTKVKFKYNIDVSYSKYDLGSFARGSMVKLKGDKELKNNINVYNLNSGDYIKIFESKYDCLNYYMEERNKYINRLKKLVGDIEEDIISNNNKLQKEIDNL